MLSVSRSTLLCSVPVAAFPLAGGAHSAAAFTPPALEPLDDSQFAEYNRRLAVVYDTQSGSFLPADPENHLAVALGRRAANERPPRVIFAGEEHTHPMHHALQLDIIKAAYALDDAPLAIGLEMFYRKVHQPALDEFVFGDGSFEALRRRTRWSTTWGYDLNYYSKIFAFARREKIRLIALNAPYRLISTVATYGYAGLPKELAPYLPTMDLENADHYARFEEAFTAAAATTATRTTAAEAAGVAGTSSVSPHGDKLSATRLRRSYEAMTMWDEFMAQSIAEALDAPLRPPLTRGAAQRPTPPTPPTTTPPPVAAADGARRRRRASSARSPTGGWSSSSAPITCAGASACRTA